MSLRNVRREPRRELIESALGLALVAPWYAIYLPATLQSHLRWLDAIQGWILASLLILSLMWLILIPLAIHHELGEIACDILDDFGIRLRPRRRPALDRLVVALGEG